MTLTRNDGGENASRWLVVFTAGYWSAKRLALLVGFVLTIIGSVGAQVFVAPIESLSTNLDLTAKDLSAKIDTLKNAQAQYIMFQEQGALVFALSASGVSEGASEGPKMISQLYQLNLLDRSQSIQTIIGWLALEKQLEYRATYDQYISLITAARKEMSLANYEAVDNMEKGLSAQATSEIGRLQISLSLVMRNKSAADTQADQRKLMLLVAMTLGSACLLAANLIATRDGGSTKVEGAPAGEKPSSEVASDDRVTELSTAAYLIEVALDQARALQNRKT
jgi:hypothetical protein